LAVYTSNYIYQPSIKRTIRESFDAFSALTGRLGIAKYGYGALGRGIYDMFEDDGDLLEYEDSSLSEIEKSLDEYSDATYLTLGWIDGEPIPNILDQLQVYMASHRQVAGDYDSMDVGITLGRVSVEDNEGDPLFSTDFLLRLGGYSSPNDCLEYPNVLLKSEPLQALFGAMESYFPADSWKSALIVS
jgi:hypothetical protein